MTTDFIFPQKYIEHKVNDKELNALILNDAFQKVNSLCEDNFTIDTIFLHLSPYKTPEVVVYIANIKNRPIYYHRQQIKTGFKIIFQQQTVYYTLSCVEKK